MGTLAPKQKNILAPDEQNILAPDGPVNAHTTFKFIQTTAIAKLRSLARTHNDGVNYGYVSKTLALTPTRAKRESLAFYGCNQIIKLI